MEYKILKNGIKIPMLGFGVYKIPPEDTKKCVLEAIKSGYRLIDTAQAYFNEEGVGQAIIESKVNRKELFITTKVWIDNYGYEKTKKSVLESLKKLKTDYIDLMLLHQPFNDIYGAYNALIDLYKEKKLKAIGVSNFYPDRLVDLANFAEIPPMINQVECHPFFQQTDAQKWNEKYGCFLEAWAPFGEGRKNMFTDKTLKAIGDKYHKTNAQVILRWLIQRGIIAVCKTVHLQRMQENFNIFDFKLSNDDMNIIASLDEFKSIFMSHMDPTTVEQFVKIVEIKRTKK